MLCRLMGELNIMEVLVKRSFVSLVGLRLVKLSTDLHSNAAWILKIGPFKYGVDRKLKFY